MRSFLNAVLARKTVQQLQVAIIFPTEITPSLSHPRQKGGGGKALSIVSVAYC